MAIILETKYICLLDNIRKETGVSYENLWSETTINSSKRVENLNEELIS